MPLPESPPRGWLWETPALGYYLAKKSISMCGAAGVWRGLDTVLDSHVDRGV